MAKKKKPKKRKDGSRPMTIVEVAARVKRFSYQTTRNMMLRGDFGPPTYDEAERKLTVPLSGVDRWLAARNDSPS